MRYARFPLVILCFLALGFVICPTRRPGYDLDPDKVLQFVFRIRPSARYEATQLRTHSYYGRTLTCRVRVHGPIDATGDIRLLQANYTPVIEGEDIIAGREAWTLRLKPKAKEKRPWKQLWVDKKMWVVLASRDWTSRNTLKSSMKTLSIRYSPSPIDTIAIFMRQKRLARALASRTVLSPPAAAVPRYIPHGFRLASADVRGERVQLVYTDGLYALSIFEGRSSEARYADDTVRDWGQGLIISTAKRARSITVIADLPPKELRKIADSVR